MTLKIITDSAGDMPAGWDEMFDFHMIPVNIHFGDKTYLQGVDLTEVEFYELAEKSGVIPKTSQPSPHQFISFYRQIASPGDTLLSIHVTSKLSGTFNSAEMAANELEGEFKIFPFDSKAGSAALAYMCREARELDRAGASMDEILQRLALIRDQMNIVLTLDTLDYARMSGRVKTLQAALASVLNIKPIIDLQDGVLDMTERVRTRKRALDRLLGIIEERVGSKPINAAIVQSLDPVTAESLRKQVEVRFNCKELIVTELSIAVAANLGPGTVGIIAYPTGEGM